MMQDKTRRPAGTKGSQGFRSPRSRRGKGRRVGPAADPAASPGAEGAAPAARCHWCGEIAEYQRYHDREWGFPVDDDRRLFEKICLEGFQAGLSWLTILRKRESFRAAFENFDAHKVARFDARDVERLLGDAGIVRHRGKIEAAINNAQRCLELIETEGSLAAFLWRYEPDPKSRPERLTRGVLSTLGIAPEATALSKELKRRGWKFVGPTTMYALMQAMGLVNDHQDDCAARALALEARRTFKVPG
ncbi:MAG: DNA-3-methyladenine glycosylase I [Pararobbsia sp.]